MIQFKKSNDLTDVTVDINTLVIVGNVSTGKYEVCSISDILSIGKTEIIDFEDVDTVIISMTTIRKKIYGDAIIIQAEIKGDDDVWRISDVEIIPDVVPNTTQYTINLGTSSTGRIKIR